MAKLQEAISIVQMILSAKPAEGIVITREVIEDEVGRVLALFPDLAHPDIRQSIIEELETRFNVWIGLARTLADDRDHIAWLPSRKSEIHWRFWPRYRLYLQPRISSVAIERLDDVTDDVLGRLEDPERPGAWSRRGLIVGHVQSGKTANYTGLVCKAADAGYKLIVVLAGMYRNLRTQTQIRLDEGFLGYVSSAPRPGTGAMRPTGVGLIDPSLRPDSITNRDDNGDFQRAIANQFNISPGGNPLLFVVKKNASVLKNLLDWVERYATAIDPETGRPVVRGVPLLVIDDEADQASVDTREIELDENGTPDPDHDPTVINSRIRRLLHCFEQNAYVGYTATPFANIYIHEKAWTTYEGEDLFPRSFIMNLPAPSNYVGPARLFGGAVSAEDDDGEALGLIRHIDDHIEPVNIGNQKSGWMPPRHRSTHVPRAGGRDEVPGSLREAIRAFVLACAARDARGQYKEHRSMLVHVTRFTNVQRQVYTQIATELNILRTRWRNGDGASSPTIREELRSLWNEDFRPTSENAAFVDCPPLDWPQIEPHVWTALSRIEVKEINGSSADVLAYEEHRETGLNVIAVGGDKLSRGLTLEGLMVSYFLRSSRMYDTLMQMGRWFGYRPGYTDLCRLYMTAELQEWFEHIAVASEELRQQFDHMAAVRATPREYGLKVKSHPVLLVTSAVKSRTGTELQLSFTGDVSETVVFHGGRRDIGHNFVATEEFLKSLGAPAERDPVRARPGGKQDRWHSTYLWNRVDGNSIVAYLKTILTHPSAHRVNRDLLSRFIMEKIQCGELVDWTVALVSATGGKKDVIRDLPIELIVRKPRESSGDRTYRIGRLLSPKDEAIDLDMDSYGAALEATRAAWTADPGRSRRKEPPEIPSGRMLRKQRPAERALLLLYPLDPEVAQVERDSKPVIGLGISFPDSGADVKIVYKVNNIYYEQEFGIPA